VLLESDHDLLGGHQQSGNSLCVVHAFYDLFVSLFPVHALSVY
jgi:hypothetical protein